MVEAVHYLKAIESECHVEPSMLDARQWLERDSYKIEYQSGAGPGLQQDYMMKCRRGVDKPLIVKLYM